MAAVLPESAGKVHRSIKPMIAVGFGIFSDSFLYGVVVPLTALSPAGVTSEAALGMLYGAYAFGVLLFTPLCGILADRLGRKRPMLVGAIVQLLATAMFAVAPNFWLLMLARIFQGGAAAATWTAGLAVVAESYPEDRVQKMGLSMVGMTAGSLLGPLAGGFLYDVAGYFAPFWMAGGFVIADFCLRWTLLPWDRGREKAGSPLALLRDRSVLVAALVIALIAGGWGVIEPHLPPHLAKEFHVSATFVGVLFMAAGIAYALVTNPVQRAAERWGLRDTIAAGLVLMAVGMPLLVLSPNVWLTTALLCVVSVAYAFAMNPTLAELADAADRCAPGAYAAVYAVFNIAYALGMIGGDFITGPLAEHFSLAVGFSALSLVLIGSVPLLWWSFKPRPAAAAAPAT